MDRLTIRGENWYSKREMGYVSINRELYSKYRHQLQTEQAYLTEDGKNILEILGIHGYEECPDLEVRIWEEIEGFNIIEGAEVKLSQLTPSCGMGCNKREKWNRIFMNTRMKRVIMGNDNYQYDVTTRRVTDILIQNIPTTTVNRKSIWSILEDKESFIRNGVIYTDGSWKDMRKKENILFRTSENKSK